MEHDNAQVRGAIGNSEGIGNMGLRYMSGCRLKEKQMSYESRQGLGQIRQITVNAVTQSDMHVCSIYSLNNNIKTICDNKTERKQTINDSLNQSTKYAQQA